MQDWVKPPSESPLPPSRLHSRDLLTGCLATTGTKSWLVGKRASLDKLAGELGILIASDQNVYLAAQPSEDPTETCWLINQYDFDKPLQYVCTANVYLSSKPSEDPTETCWLSEQYGIKDVQYICAADTSVDFDHNIPAHKDDSY